MRLQRKDRLEMKRLTAKEAHKISKRKYNQVDLLLRMVLKESKEGGFFIRINWKINQEDIEVLNELGYNVSIIENETVISWHT